MHELSSGKKKKLSQKCTLFLIANKLSVKAWSRVITDSQEYRVSANIIIHNLFRLDDENFSKIYGLTHKDFRSLNKSTKEGVTLVSCKVARMLKDRLDEELLKYDLEVG